MKDDFLDVPIEETQVQEVNTLHDLPHPSHPLPLSMRIKPLSELKTEPLRPSIQAPPQLELKTLPELLKYMSLRLEKILAVIIASDLTAEQKDQLLNILKTYREAIGWTVAELKDISPLICMHHIYTEDNVKPTREMHRWLNLNM